MIRLTKQTDYGIVLLSLMAVEPERRYNAPGLAASTKLPQPMVSKILKVLARDGVLDSHRGVKGGYQLARPATQISMADIIGTLDGPIAITECIEDGPDECSYEASCQIRGHWQTINAAIRDALERIKLSEMAGAELPFAEAGKDVPLVSLGRLH